MSIVELLLELGKATSRFLLGDVPEALVGLGETMVRLSSTDVIDAVVELGTTSLRYSRTARGLIVPGVGVALISTAITWPVALAVVGAGALWWVNRL